MTNEQIEEILGKMVTQAKILSRDYTSLRFDYLKVYTDGSMAAACTRNFCGDLDEETVSFSVDELLMPLEEAQTKIREKIQIEKFRRELELERQAEAQKLREIDFFKQLGKKYGLLSEDEHEDIETKKKQAFRIK